MSGLNIVLMKSLILLFLLLFAFIFLMFFMIPP
jgi:hypothetical protein